MRLFILFFLAILCLSFASAQEKYDPDTMYYAEPVTILATHASDRISPVTYDRWRV